MCRQQKDQEILNKHNEGISNEAKSTKHFPKCTYNQGEDNSAYYELGDFSQESQYDKLPSHDWHNHRNLFSVHNYVYEYHSHLQRIPCKITYPYYFSQHNNLLHLSKIILDIFFDVLLFIKKFSVCIIQLLLIFRWILYF